MAAIDNFVMHLVPGGTVGLNPKTAGEPYEMTRNRMGVVVDNTWAFCQNNVVPQGTCVNEVNVALGLAGWRSRFTQVANDAVAGVALMGTFSIGAMSTFPHIVNAAGVMTGAITDQAIVSKLGLWFLETEAIVIPSATGGAADFAFLLSPSWNSGNTGRFWRTDGFGIAWTNLTGPNYQLFIANAAGVGGPYVAIIDTGINALNEIHHLRVEWGYDTQIQKIVIRAIIDDVEVAELLGPFVCGPSAFGNAVFCGLDGSDQDLTKSIDAWFGFGTGLKMGAFELSPIPPTPPVSNLNACSVITPTFFEQSAGVIPTFQPCSGTGQGTQSGNCG